MIATFGLRDLLASDGWSDPSRNEVHGPCITTDASRVPVYVMCTDEERTIVQHTPRVLRDPG